MKRIRQEKTRVRAPYRNQELVLYLSEPAGIKDSLVNEITQEAKAPFTNRNK